MGLFAKPLYTISEDVKRGVFGKKYTVSVDIYDDHIFGEAFELNDNDLSPKSFDIPFEKTLSVQMESVDGKECVTVDYINNSVVSRTRAKLVLWGLKNPTTVADQIKTAFLKYKSLREQEMLQKRAEEERKLLALQKEKEEAALFYKNCYEFHIKPETPLYVFSTEENFLAGLCISSDKSLNFIRIDGSTREEDVGTIPYSKIHYFEKAGNLSYVSNTHGSYSSYGGSFTGGSFSKKAAVIGGLLFGRMGLAAGTLLTYKPAKADPIKTDFKLQTDIVKIDERSVMLNFYSDTKGQYIDIELPQDIYNFLQTHLPEKKYSIVEELEKRSAAHQARDDIETGQQLYIGQTVAPKLSDTANSRKDSMEEFKLKVEKLKIMKESGLLTDEEFLEERKKLMGMI